MNGINKWDEVLSGNDQYVKLEEGKRVALVGKNPRFNQVEKEFKGQDKKMYDQLTIDIIDENGVPCNKELNTISKRFMTGLRPLFENVSPETPVAFTVKKIGKDTDTNYDVEAIQPRPQQ